MKRLFITLLCCGRVDLLEKTLASFFKRCKDIRSYEVHAIVSDDSGDKILNTRIKEIVEKFFPINSIKFRFGENVGQAASFWHLSNLVKESYSDQDLCFILEEDWIFAEDFEIREIELAFGVSDKFRVVSAVLRSDVDKFETYPASGYNIVESLDPRLILIAPKKMQGFARLKGDCPHNEIICFHPGAILAKDVARYAEHYNLKDLVFIKESAERLLGLITPGMRAFIVDKTYTVHTGDYRIYSVFPGAKVRNGVKMVNIDEIKSKLS